MAGKEQQRVTVADLAEQLDQLRERVAELEAALGQLDRRRRTGPQAPTRHTFHGESTGRREL